MDVFPYPTNGEGAEAFGNAFQLLMFVTYSKDMKMRTSSEKIYINNYYNEPKPAAIAKEQLPTDVRDFLQKWLDRASESETRAYIRSWPTPLAHVEMSLSELNALSDDAKYKEVLYQMVSHKVKDKKCQFVSMYTQSAIEKKINILRRTLKGGKKPEDLINIDKLMTDLEDLIKIPKKFEDGSEEPEIMYMSKMFNAQYAHEFWTNFIPELKRVKPELNVKGGRRKKLKTKLRSRRKTKKISKRK